MQLEALVARLEEDGLLLLADAKLQSLVSLVAGGPIRGSWWSHPRGKEIFRRMQELEAHEDVLVVKLVDRRVTLVHRRLWPALLAVARAREPWQMERLSRAGAALLARVDSEGELEAQGAAVKELELRLLVHAAQVHTPSGAHALVLATWARWAKRHAPIGRSPPPARARALLGEALARLNAMHGASSGLPFATGSETRVDSNRETQGAGYSGTPLDKKLGIKAGGNLWLIDAPPEFEKTLGKLPDGVTVARAKPRGRTCDVIVLFAKTKKELARGFSSAKKQLVENGGLWVAWPKKASGVDTELTETVVRAHGLAGGLVDNKVCAIDATWSGLRFVVRLADRAR